MTTSTRGTGVQTSLRALLASLAVVAAVLGAGSAAMASDNQGDPRTPGHAQVLLCEGGGGSAMIDINAAGGGDNAGGFPNMVTVECEGGSFDGMLCDYYDNGETWCVGPRRVAPPKRGSGGPTLAIPASTAPEAGESAFGAPADPESNPSGMSPLDEEGA